MSWENKQKNNLYFQRVKSRVHKPAQHSALYLLIQTRSYSKPISSNPENAYKTDVQQIHIRLTSNKLTTKVCCASISMGFHQFTNASSVCLSLKYILTVNTSIPGNTSSWRCEQKLLVDDAMIKIF